MNGLRFGIPIPQPDSSIEDVQKTDPDRLIWYGPCLYWTDNWDMVWVSPLRIPVCPVCHAPGFQMTYREWMDGAERFAKETNQPGYPEWLLSVKEQCCPDTSMWKRRGDK